MKSASSALISTFVAVAIVILLGLASSLFLTHRIDKNQRSLLLVQAKQATLLVSTQDIASLSGTEADLANPIYQRLKTQFTHFREANPEIRFVYLMGYHPEIRTQFFYVDSEPTTSDDYSPPGQLFGDTREWDIKQYLAGEPYTDGPYEDSWGQWVSGYVPIKNEQGSVVAMIGIDIATSVWHNQIIFTRIMIAVIALLLITLIVIIGTHFYRKLRSFNALSIQNQQLTQQQGVLKHVQQLAQVGAFVITFPEENVVVGEQFQKLFTNTRMDKNTWKSYIHSDDQEKYESMINEITTTTIVYSWVDIRVGTAEAGFRKYHIYGNIERHASGPAKRFDGVMQDITDIK
jgi:hypothetical protein